MKKRVMMILASALMVVGLGACDDFLNVENYEQEISTLTENVNFKADKAICKRFEDIYANYPKHTNYFFELTGPKDEKGEQDVMILDLMLPEIKVGLEGEYKVGYTGDYIALSKFDVIDSASGMMYTGGCCYGKAKNGYISDYYGYLTEGRVLISSVDGNYYVTVEAKSEEHTVWVQYIGPLEIIEGK